MPSRYKINDVLEVDAAKYNPTKGIKTKRIFLYLSSSLRVNKQKMYADKIITGPYCIC